ncbi:hypothetical protein BDV12DRAFT_198506 [Aspergillus spectabilis]
MSLRAILLSVALLAVAGGAAPGNTAVNLATSNVGNDAATANDTQDTKRCPVNCMDYKDCCEGDFCIAGSCIVGHKAIEAIKARNVDTSYFVSEDEDDYDFYHFVTDANGQKKKKGTDGCCPKKCGNGLHCCKHDFCQLGECRGTHEP